MSAGSQWEHAWKVRLRLPATSANLGPGFDAVAVALDFYLEIEAEPAAEFSIAATGRDAERCSRIEDNLILGDLQEALAGKRQACDSACDSNGERNSAGDGLWLVGGGTAGGDRAGGAFRQLGWSSAADSRRRLARWRAIRTMQPPAGWADSLPPRAKGENVHVARVIPPAGVASNCRSSTGPVGHQQGARGAAGELLPRRYGCEYPGSYRCSAWHLRRLAAICCGLR